MVTVVYFEILWCSDRIWWRQQCINQYTADKNLKNNAVHFDTLNFEVSWTTPEKLLEYTPELKSNSTMWVVHPRIWCIQWPKRIIVHSIKTWTLDNIMNIPSNAWLLLYRFEAWPREQMSKAGALDTTTDKSYFPGARFTGIIIGRGATRSEQIKPYFPRQSLRNFWRMMVLSTSAKKVRNGDYELQETLLAFKSVFIRLLSLTAGTTWS